MFDQIREASGTFSCPSCGGRPLWDPAEQQLKCPFCGSVSAVEMDFTPPAEYALDSAPPVQALDWGEQKRVIHCQACGAETILGPGESATLCAFCGSPHVLEDQSAAGIAPESVLPFTVPQHSAVSAFRKWLKGKFFAPAKAKKMAVLGQITGVYLPHWTYDSDTTSDYTGQAGHYYYVTVPVTVQRNGKTVREMRQERRTRWTPTSGRVYQHFNDVLVAGSKRLPEKLLSRVRPYDLSRLCRYRPGFLSGFSAEKPSVNLAEGWEGAQRVIDEEMRSLARADILTHADDAQVSSLSSEHENVRYKLTLLPMYLSSFSYKDKLFHVLVNGQTGKCGGEAPVSALRVTLVVLAALAVIGLLLYLYFSNGGEVDVGEMLRYVEYNF